MPAAATTPIGNGKSVPIMAFAWGPRNLSEYSGLISEQYAYLWVALLTPDKSAIELYQAVDAGGNPWKAGQSVSGAAYALRKSLPTGPSGEYSQTIKWIGLSFTPSGKARFGVVHENPESEPPNAHMLVGTIIDDNIAYRQYEKLFKNDGDTRTTGLVLFNTSQLHGRLQRAMTVAIVGLYNATEDGTRILTIGNPIDTADLGIQAINTLSGGKMTGTIGVLRQHVVATSAYLYGEWYIVSTNAVFNPNLMWSGTNGQIALYSPESESVEFMTVRPISRPGFYRKGLVIGDENDPIGDASQTIGLLSEVEIGEHQYGAQGEGLKVACYGFYVG